MSKKAMTEPLSAVRNVGPAMAERLQRAGIVDAAALRALGADAAYRRMLEAGDRPHLMAYQAMAPTLEGRPSNDLDATERQRLRDRFAALKREARSAPSPAIEAELDALGMIAPAPARGRPDTAESGAGAPSPGRR